MKELKEETRKMIERIRLGCGIFRQYSTETENSDRRNEVKLKINVFCKECIDNLSVANPELLLALLEAYEVTGDEVMLQRVLDVVSGNLEQLSVSAEHVKLLAYCYYYVEEEECAERARRMLEELKGKTDGERWWEAEQVYRELVGQD